MNLRFLQSNTSLILSFAHVFITSPILLAYTLTDLFEFPSVPSYYFYWPFVLTVYGIGAYHIYRYWTTQSRVNLFHLIGIFPLLFYYAYYGDSVIRPVKYMTIGIAITSIIYHIRRFL